MVDKIDIGREWRDVFQIARKEMNVAAFKPLEIVGIPHQGEDLGIFPFLKRIDQMTSDKARAAGDEDFHDPDFRRIH